MISYIHHRGEEIRPFQLKVIDIAQGTSNHSLLLLSIAAYRRSIDIRKVASNCRSYVQFSFFTSHLLMQRAQRTEKEKTSSNMHYDNVSLMNTQNLNNVLLDILHFCDNSNLHSSIIFILLLFRIDSCNSFFFFYLKCIAIFQFSLQTSVLALHFISAL